MSEFVKFEQNPNLEKLLEKGFSNGLAALKEQALGDANEYVRVDSGVLRSSGHAVITDMNLDLIWDTPYAAKVYFTGTPRRNINSNASLLWAQVAQQRHGAGWNRIITKGMSTI